MSTKHLQFLVYFESGKSGTFWKGLGCWTTAIPQKDAERVRNYCSKEDTRLEGPWTYGKLPLFHSAKSADYSAALSLCKEGRIPEIEASIQVRNWTNLQKIASQYAQPNELDASCGLWFYGPSNAGKSYAARTEYPSVYVKSLDEIYWECYTDEKTILLDDLDPSHWRLGGKLKVWADPYKKRCPIKGASAALKYDRIIVTSQYLPDQIWKDPKTLDAIKRRYQLRVFHERTGAELQAKISANGWDATAALLAKEKDVKEKELTSEITGFRKLDASYFRQFLD